MSENRFDERAATWDDDPSHVERAAAVANVIRNTVTLDGTARMLEYGAGTGLVAQALRDDVGPITMADTSAGMRTVMQAKIDAGLIPGAQIWDADLATGEAPALAEPFDLIVTVLAMHHIPDIEPVLLNFAALLADRGSVAIVDFDEEDGTFHPEGFDGHHGFNRTALAAKLEQAGFTDVAFQSCHQIVRDGRAYGLFLATATRRVRP